MLLFVEDFKRDLKISVLTYLAEEVIVTTPKSKQKLSKT